MRACSSLLVLLAVAPWTLAGCPGRCPPAERAAASVTQMGGTLESAGITGPQSYELTTTYVAGPQCLARVGGGQRDETDEESFVRADLVIDCQTSLVPLLRVRLPDLRGTEQSPAPVPASVDVTLGEDCAVELAGVPIELTVLDAQGDAAPAPSYVTPGYVREALASIDIDPAAQPGTLPNGSPCALTAPAFSLDLQVTQTDDDFGESSGGGCL